MGKTRGPYPAEFRQQIVELVRAGRSPRELAEEFERWKGNVEQIDDILIIGVKV